MPRDRCGVSNLDDAPYEACGTSTAQWTLELEAARTFADLPGGDEGQAAPSRRRPRR